MKISNRRYIHVPRWGPNFSRIRCHISVWGVAEEDNQADATRS